MARKGKRTPLEALVKVFGSRTATGNIRKVAVGFHDLFQKNKMERSTGLCLEEFPDRGRVILALILV